MPALEGFLKDLKAAGRLAPIPGGEGHDIPFLSAWNSVIGDGSPYEGGALYAWREITDELAHRILFNATYEGGRGRGGFQSKAGSREEAYAVMVEIADLGTFAGLDRLESMKCGVTGISMLKEIVEWQPNYYSLVYDASGVLSRCPMTDIAPAQVMELEFDAGSGDLLVADWFRIAEFTANVKLSAQKSLNSRDGMEEATRRYLDERGFLCVGVGNTSPDILEIDGTLVIGWADPDDDDLPAGIVSRGSVTTDRWSVTMIDRRSR